jgi:hypothetical protein
MRAQTTAREICRWITRALAVATAVVLWCAASASAACVPGGKGPITPSADTYANQSEPSVNYGSANGWTAANVTTGFAAFTSNNLMHGYVKYPLPTIPSGCSLNKAVIRLANPKDYILVLKPVPPPFLPAPLYIRAAAKSWGESTLTWKNQPGGTGPSVKITSEMLSGTWTITPAVAALYSGGNTGLEVSATDPNAWFSPNSREYLKKYGNKGIPYLWVNWK